MGKLNELNDRQIAFAEYYIQENNARIAAEKAGYSKKTARKIGAENLHKPAIEAYIRELRKKVRSDRIASIEEVLETFTRIMRREEKENIVVTIKKRTSSYDKNGKKKIIETEEPQIVQIPAKISDVNRAAEALAKRYGLFSVNREEETEDIDASREEVYSDEQNP